MAGAVVENLAKRSVCCAEVRCSVLCRCGGFLRSLSLNGCQAVGDSALATFARNCPNIETLNLGSCGRVTDHTCSSLARHCPRLKQLGSTLQWQPTNQSTDRPTDPIFRPRNRLFALHGVCQICPAATT